MIAFVLSPLFCATSAQAQQFTVSGTVVDESTQQPIQFASITARQAAKRVSSDKNGHYALTLPAGTHTYTVSFIGYKTESITVSGQDKDIRMNIRLKSLDYLLQEVSVYSRNNKASTVDIEQVGVLSLSSETVQKSSGMLKDAFRSVQTMAGVSGNNELSARFNVRGGNQDENLVLVNGTQVFEPYHIKYASAASIGVFNIDLVKSMDIMTGGFSAQYGDRMSSVLNLQYREGSRERVQGQVGISLTNFDALVEGPLGEHGSFIIGARRSFVEYMLKALAIEEGVHPSFYDIQGQVNYDLAPEHKLSFQFVQSGDDFRLDPIVYTTQNKSQGTINGRAAAFTYNDNEVENITNGYGSTMLNLRSTNVLSSSTLLKIEAAYYNQFDDENRTYQYGSRTDAVETNIAAGTPHQYLNTYDRQSSRKNRLNIITLEARAALETQISSWYELRVGASYQNIRYSQNLAETDTRRSQNTFASYPDTIVRTWSSLPGNYTPQIIEARSFKTSAFIENVLQADESLTFNIGGRLDYFDINQDLNISPRVSVSYKAPFGTTFRAAWGLYSQSPLYQQLRLSERSDTNTKAQRAAHYILSAERQFAVGDDASLSVKMEGYYKRYDHLISVLRAEGTQITYSRQNDAEGFARGVDLTVSLNAGRFNGWISYGLLDAQERLVADTVGYYPRFTDQRHTFSLVADYNLGAGWSAGIRFAYGSGFTYTPATAVFNEKSKQWSWVQGAKNSASYPSYQRLDIRADKRFSFFGLASFVYLDVSNVLNHTNVLSYGYTFNSDSTPRRETENLWPIVPTLGLTVSF